jgi:hypothetical protein
MPLEASLSFKWIILGFRNVSARVKKQNNVTGNYN